MRYDNKIKINEKISNYQILFGLFERGGIRHTHTHAIVKSFGNEHCSKLN